MIASAHYLKLVTGESPTAKVGGKVISPVTEHPLEGSSKMENAGSYYLATSEDILSVAGHYTEGD